MNGQTAFYASMFALAAFLVMLVVYALGRGHRRRPAVWRHAAEIDSATKLVHAQKYQEAEAILLPVSQQSDAPIEIFHLLSLCAERQGNLAEAARRWQREYKLFPTDPPGYVGAAQLMIRQNRRSQAEALLARAARKVINPAALTKVLAELADADGDREGAVRLWAQVRAQGPGITEAYVKGHAALLAAGRPSEAAEVLADAAMRFPSDKLIRAAIDKAAREKPT